MKKVIVLLVSVLLFTACSSDKNLFKQAQLAASKGKFTQAIELYTRLIKKDPKHCAAHINRGVLWERVPVKDASERVKNRKRAEADYLAALRIDSSLPEIYNNLGALYMDMGQPLDAIFYLTEAVSRNPHYFMGWMNRAIANYRLGRAVAALADFNRAAELRPDDPLLLLNRALTYYDMQKYELAAEDLTHLIAVNPDDARAYLERARVFIKMGYPANAYADLEEAVTIKPSYALAYYYMGDLMFRRGEKELALGLLIRSKELANQYVPTYELMGDMLAMEDPVSAVANYKTAKRLDPENARRYDAKLRLMLTEEGRFRIVTERFFPQAGV